MSNFENRSIRPYIVGEVAQTHDGSLGQALRFVDLCADIGLDAVKFQMHYAEYESTLDEPFRVSLSTQDKNRYSYWKRTEFRPEDWRTVAEHCKVREIDFVASVFSAYAFEILRELNPPFWKIPSGEVNNYEILELMARYPKPVIISTGLAEENDIHATTDFFQTKGLQVLLMHCTSLYPTPLACVDMSNIEKLGSEYSLEIGLSDHTGTIWPAVYAMCNQVNLIEIHVTINKKYQFGPDVSSSLDVDEIKWLVRGKDAVVALRKELNSEKRFERKPFYKSYFERSVALRQDLKSGYRLRQSDLIMKKPGGGISHAELPKLVGRQLRTDVSSLRLLRWEDLE